MEKSLIHMDRDGWREIFSFLMASDACRLAAVSKTLNNFVNEDELAWRRLLSWGDPRLIKQLQQEQLLLANKTSADIITCADLREVAKRVESCSDLGLVSWSLVDFEKRRDRIPAMEAHAAVSIVDRFVAVVGGWGAPDNANSLFVLDGASLAASYKERNESCDINQPNRRLRRVPCRTLNAPRFRYGFTATMLDGVPVAR